MGLKLLQITASEAAETSIRRIAAEHDALSFHRGVAIDGDHCIYFVLTGPTKRQQLIDGLYDVLAASSQARISILPVDATIPPVKAENPSDTREELYLKMEQGARFDMTFVTLSVLSTIVALIGLLTNNIAVVIGAMVIAPYLGPNLAFAFGTALGDTALMRRAMATALGGAGLSIAMAAIAGLFVEIPEASPELYSRTSVDLAGIALAAASGAAGVLSLTSGLSMSLVGVMVAVALLPPAATFGFMMGAGEWRFAAGALALLVVNIVCVNLAALTIFLVKGFAPRTWFERRMAKPYVYGGLLLWTTALILLIVGVGVFSIDPSLSVSP